MATRDPDYYEILHVSADAPLEIIKASYRTMMQKLKMHPDLGGDTDTATLINEAYAVLSNEQRRAEYDATFTDEPDAEPDQEEIQPAPEPPRILDPARECVFCELVHGLGSGIDAESRCTSCNSPLLPAEKVRLSSDNQRAVDRIGSVQVITIFTHWPQANGIFAQTEDISLNGLRLVTRHDLRRGQRIKIVNDVLEAVGSVTHCSYELRGLSPRCTAGVVFETILFARKVGGLVSRRV